ncbi:MAG TPA: C39 family peptidase [Tepidisphaeraceae bacterium]|nr:C39 family peptidase [Tepidisphaeraceae bacterium]
MNRILSASLGLLACGFVVVTTGCSSSGGGSSDPAKAKAIDVPADATKSSCANFKEVIVKQATPVWCWAASAEMVHRYYGRTDITQDALAKKITNASKDDPEKIRSAGLQEIMLALQPEYDQRAADNMSNALADGEIEIDYVNAAGSFFMQNNATSDDLIDAIVGGNPAIVGLRDPNTKMGHAVVVFGVTYKPTGKEQESNAFTGFMDSLTNNNASAFGIKGPAKYALYEIQYADPMDGKRYSLNAGLFASRKDFIMTRDRAAQVLEKQMQSIK